MVGKKKNERVLVKGVEEQKLHLEPLAIKKKDETDMYVYQYRSLESFWAIVESDCFWATNARYSNDQEEQILGTQKILEVLEEDGDDKEGVRNLADCYIICFCNKDDKLSQWRGYASEGVSIGFDFANVRPFYIKKKDEDAYICVYNSCYMVKYISRKTGKDEFIHKFDLDTPTDEVDREKIKIQAVNIIPYVKHEGFIEEEESRLMFSDQDTDLSECVHYRNAGNIKVPYIIVKAGDKKEKKKRTCIVRMNVEKKVGQELEKELSGYFSNKLIKSVKVVNCTDESGKELGDQLCYGCTLRQTFMPGVDNEMPRCRLMSENGGFFRTVIHNAIYISDSRNQEQIYNVVYDFLKNSKWADIKIWCEGHLPIRSITVGSMKNSDIVYESIRHYCDHHYWLRSVDVRKSGIPYRNSLD